jgi:hypothetical protein
MNEARNLIISALRNLTVRSAACYWWFGERMEVLPRRMAKTVPQAVAMEYLLHALRQGLYRDFYCQGAAAPANAGTAAAVTALRADFVESLSAANFGSGTHQPGWRVRSFEDGQTIVNRGGLSLWIPSADVISDAGAGTEVAQVGIPWPKEVRNLSPGFYMAIGNNWLNTDATSEIVRLYWHVRSDGAAHLLRAATRVLNDAHLSFRLKVINHPARYTRCDPGVLYFNKHDSPQVMRHAAKIYHKLSAFIELATPVFTKRLAPGLGLAEDPGDGDSFGMHRCGLLANGVIRALAKDRPTPQRRMEVIEQVFAESGISLDRPHLNPGSVDLYRFSLG